MLNVQNLSCRRQGRVVFHAVRFTLAAGGFLRVTGANGSGKSSLLRVLAGLIEPASGSVVWRGGIEDTPPPLHYIGHLDALKTGVSVREMLDYWRALRGDAAVTIDCLDVFGLSAFHDRPIRTLSAGQKRRLSLCRLLLTPAPVWLLDEPTTALDVAGQALLRDQIARHRAAGGIVIAATHDALDIPQAQDLVMTGSAV